MKSSLLALSIFAGCTHPVAKPTDVAALEGRELPLATLLAQESTAYHHALVEYLSEDAQDDTKPAEATILNGEPWTIAGLSPGPYLMQITLLNSAGQPLGGTCDAYPVRVRSNNSLADAVVNDGDVEFCPWERPDHDGMIP